VLQLEFDFEVRWDELHDARAAVMEVLEQRGLDPTHSRDVATVVHELIAAARECGVTSALHLQLATYPLFTSVRLRCDRNVELRDKPFDVRERLIQHIAIAFGRRRRDDGTVDLWAEIAAPR
jgi:hypothetical protein